MYIYSGVLNFIASQKSIIGPAAVGKAEHLPDNGHILKDCSNGIYDIRAKDKSFSGKGLLENARIKAIISDIRSALTWYKSHKGDDGAKARCLGMIKAIPTHHCGNHSLCHWEDVCRYTEIRNQNPTWPEDKIQQEYASTAIRFGGRCMELSYDGVRVIQAELMRRFNDKNIDKIAEMSCSNDCEGFYSVLAKFSEGKRLNLEHTDLWRNMIMLVFCRTGMIEDCHQELSQLLNLEITTIEVMALMKRKKKRKGNKARSGSKAGKQARIDAKVTNTIRMGKEDSKKRHKSGKLSTTKPTEPKVKHCTKCDQNGHAARDCPVLKPKRKRKKVPAVDWNILDPPPKKAKKYTAKIKW